MKEVSFSVSGEFLTKFYREKLWQEKKPYHEVELEFMKCLVGSGISQEMKRDAIREILSGNAKLVGVNTLSVKDDHDESCMDLDTESLLNRVYELEELVNSLIPYKEALEEIHADLSDRADPIQKMRRKLWDSNMITSIDWDSIFGEPDDDLKQRFNTFCVEHGIYPVRSYYGYWEWISFNDKETDSPLDAEDLKERGVSIPDDYKQDNEYDSKQDVEEEVFVAPYGWLSPAGVFYEGDFGEHEEVAQDIVTSHNWREDFMSSGNLTAGDYLVSNKGYVLLDNPCVVGRTQITHKKPFTKAQGEYLFDYFVKCGDKAYALALIGDDF